MSSKPSYYQRFLKKWGAVVGAFMMLFNRHPQAKTTPIPTEVVASVVDESRTSMLSNVNESRNEISQKEAGRAFRHLGERMEDDHKAKIKALTKKDEDIS